MIDKTNNVSFKGIYYVPSIKYLSDKNKEKVQDFIIAANSHFPDNDIFLSSDESGQVYMRAQKANPLHKLADTEIAAKMNITLPQLVDLINLTSALQSAHNKVWDIKEPYALDATKNIDEMDSMDLTFQFCRTIDLFNKTHKDLEN